MSTPSKPAPDKAPTKWTIQFGLPASEILVDDFGCSLWHKFHLPGRMFVFQYHMCFLHKMPPMNEMVLVIPLTTVMTVEKAKSMKVLNNAIEVEHSGKSADGSEDGPTKLFFSNFMKRDTAWEILKRTWDLVTDLSQIKNATEAAEERHRISLSAAPAEVEQIMSSQMSPPSTPPQTKSPTSPARSSPHAAPPLQLPPVAKHSRNLSTHSRNGSLTEDPASPRRRSCTTLASDDTVAFQHALAISFGIPEMEQLVCDAECQIEVRPMDSDGDFPKIKSHMYAFKNYICFTNQESDWAGGASDLAGRTKTWTLKLSNVTNVEKKSVALVVGNAIRICGGKQQFFISGIKDRDEVFIKLDRTWKTSQSMVGITGPQPDPVAREPMPTPPITPPLDAAIPSTTPGSTPGTSPALKPTAAPTAAATATSDGPSSGHSSIHAIAGSVAPWLPYLTASLLVLFALWLVLLMMRLEAVQVRLSSFRSAGAVCPSTADTSSTRGVHDDEMRLELTALQTQVQRLIDRLG